MTDHVKSPGAVDHAAMEPAEDRLDDRGTGSGCQVTPAAAMEPAEDRLGDACSRVAAPLATPQWSQPRTGWMTAYRCGIPRLDWPQWSRPRTAG